MFKVANSVEITEIFETIQGEGPYAGTPALFIRTGKCNLTCSWCDTPYTWKTGETKYETWSYKKVIEKAAQSKRQHIVITGGEPLLHQSFIDALAKALPEKFIEVETNGTIPLAIEETIIGHFNISPKLGNSKNAWYKLNLRTPKSIFKFVVQTPEDVEEVEKFLEKNSLDRGRIYLMPEGTKRDTIQKRSGWLIPLCKKKKFHYTSRLHILKSLP